MPNKTVTVRYANNAIDQMSVLVFKRRKRRRHGKIQRVVTVDKDGVSGNCVATVEVPNVGGNSVVMLKILGIKKANGQVLSLYTRKV